MPKRAVRVAPLSQSRLFVVRSETMFGWPGTPHGMVNPMQQFMMAAAQGFGGQPQLGGMMGLGGQALLSGAQQQQGVTTPFALHVAGAPEAQASPAEVGHPASAANAHAPAQSVDHSRSPRRHSGTAEPGADRGADEIP